jgi:hypothetical protein
LGSPLAARTLAAALRRIVPRSNHTQYQSLFRIARRALMVVDPPKKALAINTVATKSCATLFLRCARNLPLA